MLLTHLSSLNLDLSQNIITNDLLKKALSEVDETHHAGEAKTTESLNKALWDLVKDSTIEVTASKLIDTINNSDSFVLFDEKTWALVHLVCARCQDDRQGIYILIFGLLKRAPDSAIAMQARLFLMSQPDFSSATDDELAELIVHPILASNDHWAWYALLVYPAFKMNTYDCTRLKENLPNAFNVSESYRESADNATALDRNKIASSLWVFVKSSGITNDIGSTILLNNLVALNITDEIASICIKDVLTAIIKLSNRVENLSSEAKDFLGTLWGKLVSQWDESTLEQQQELSVTQDNPVALKKKKDKFKSANAEEIINQFVLMIQKDLLDNILANNDANVVSEKINEALGFPVATFFCRSFSGALWDARNAFRRQCSESSVNWLLNLNIFKNFIFCQNKSDINSILFAFSSDVYFIDKLFSHFCRLSKEELSIAIGAITQYAASAEAHGNFKTQLQVKQILQLEEIFVTAQTGAELEGKRYLLQHPEVLVYTLKHHYASILMHAIDAIDAVGLSDIALENAKELAYKRIKRTFKLVEQLGDNRHNSLPIRGSSTKTTEQLHDEDNLKAQLENETWYAQFRLQFRLRRYEHKEVKQRIPVENAKRTLKMDVLDYLIKNLPKIKREHEAGRVPHFPPLRELYRLINGGLPKDKTIADIKKWFLDEVLHNRTGKSKMAQALADLPETLVENIFERSGITHEEIWKKGQPKRPFTKEERAAAHRELELEHETSSERESGLDTSSALFSNAVHLARQSGTGWKVASNHSINSPSRQ